ncbi:MAG: hypothetical protein LBH64_05160, partial [Coriobacteriales bacterium]|jgi:hypothetical protein|nr:hypothetical protein [Coriobacteriales bacterium]
MLESKVLRCVWAYLDESYEGNLFDLLCSNIGYYGIEYSAHIDNKTLGTTSFFERTSTCDRQCHSCAYCRELASQLLGYGWVSKENLEDLGEFELIDAVERQFRGRFPICKEFSRQRGKGAHDDATDTFVARS